MMGNGKLPRVSSSLSLNAIGPGVGNKNSPLQDRSELANSQEESTVSEQIPNGDSGLKASNDLNSMNGKVVSKGKSKESTASPSVNTTKVLEANDDWNTKAMEGNGNENSPVKREEEVKENTNNNNTKPPEPPKDYIHVRARRDYAIDSHNKSERVRREKISAQMKRLEDLVPGCNKVAGRVLVLDEIINYVQSLQRQVEHRNTKENGNLQSAIRSFETNNLITRDVEANNDYNNEADCSIESFSRKVTLEKMLVIINFMLELPSTVLEQLSSVYKPQYALIGMLISLIVMLVCVVELIYKGRKQKVQWMWRTSTRNIVLPWFYYSSPIYIRRFGSFFDITGLVCSICQCIVTIINYAFIHRHANNPIKFSVWPIIFACGLLCSKFCGEPDMRATS